MSLKVSVKNKTTLILEEEGHIGDEINLLDVTNVDTREIEARIEDKKDEIYQRKLQEAKEKFDLEKENVEEEKRSDDDVIMSTVNADYTPKPLLTEDEQKVSDSLKEEDDYTNHRLRILEERLDEQDRLLQEKNEILKELENQKILETTSKLVNTSLEQIKKDSQLASMIKNVDEFELEYRSFIIDYLEKERNKDE